MAAGGDTPRPISLFYSYSHEDEPLLVRLKAVPKDGRAVTAWPNEDAAFEDVAARIEALVERIRAERAAAAAPHPSPLPGGEGGSAPHPGPLPQAGEGGRAPHPGPLPQAGEGVKSAAASPSPAPRERAGVRVLKDFEVFCDIDAPWCPEMVAIPAGTFLMGSPEKEEGRYGNEGPQHKVTIGTRWLASAGTTH